MGFARRYEARASIVPWHFLTTYSNLFLKPVLRDMGEEIYIDLEASGGVVINHLPKVFLIDKLGFVREILFEPIPRSRHDPWRHQDAAARRVEGQRT